MSLLFGAQTVLTTLEITSSGARCLSRHWQVLEEARVQLWAACGKVMGAASISHRPPFCRTHDSRENPRRASFLPNLRSPSTVDWTRVPHTSPCLTYTMVSLWLTSVTANNWAEWTKVQRSSEIALCSAGAGKAGSVWKQQALRIAQFQTKSL